MIEYIQRKFKATCKNVQRNSMIQLKIRQIESSIRTIFSRKRRKFGIQTMFKWRNVARISNHDIDSKTRTPQRRQFFPQTDSFSDSLSNIYIYIYIYKKREMRTNEMKSGEKREMRNAKGGENQMASLFNRIRMRMRPTAVATESKCQL